MSVDVPAVMRVLMTWLGVSVIKELSQINMKPKVVKRISTSFVKNRLAMLTDICIYFY